MGPDESGSFLYNLLKVRRGELARTALFFVYLLNAVGAIIIGRNVAAALFLAEYDADRLPWMYVLSALAVAISAWLYSRVVGRVRLDRLVAITTALLIALLIGARFALAAHIPLVYPALYVLVEVMGALVIIQFWSFTNAVHNTREAKRLFGIIGAGGVLANVVVGFGAAALVGVIGTENLVWVMIGNLAICGVLVTLLGRRGARALAQELVGRRPKKQRRSRLAAEAGRVLTSKHLRIIAAIVAVTFMVTTLVDYQFKILARAAYDKTQLTAFFSLLYGFTGILSLTIQLFVTSRLLERFGILTALVLLPLSLTLGSVATLLFPIAMVAASVKGADAVFRYTVNDATTQLLYLPVPARNRSRAKAFIDGIVKPTSYGLTGLVLAGAVDLYPGLNDHVQVLAIPALVLGLVWLGLVFGIQGEYVKSLLDTLRRRRLNLSESRVRISDESTIRALARALEGGRPAEVVNALEMLPYVENHDFDAQVAALLDHPSSGIRTRALEHLSRNGSLEFGSRVHRLFSDESDDVRAAAITCYCAIGREKAIRVVRSFLDDEVAAVRAAAMVGMIKYGGLDGVLAAAESLKAMLENEDPTLREHGARVLGAIQVRNFYQPVLRLLGDREQSVQLAAIASAGRMKSPELVPPLVYKLADQATAAAAVGALAAYGAGIERTLAKVLDNDQEDPAIRRNVPRILGRLGTARAASILAAHLEHADEALRHRVCRALNRIHHRGPDLAVDAKAVRAAIFKEVQAGFEVLRTIEDIDLHAGDQKHEGLLASALREKLERTEERIFLLLGVLHPSRTMELVFGSLRADDVATRANALEVLDNTLGKETKQVVLPLVDERPVREKLAVATEIFGVGPRDGPASLDALLADPNPWIVACALHHLGRTGDPESGRLAIAHLAATAPVVRETAAAIVAAHLPADEVRLHLSALVADPSPLVRRAVTARLDALGPQGAVPLARTP